MQIKTNNLLEILPKILLSVRRKFSFWLVTLRLNTTFKIWSSISSPWYMGLWWSWAEFPTGVNSTAGFFFSSICLHIFFWEILGKISKKSWQTTSIFITQEIKLSKHFFLISNQDKNSKYLLGLFPHSKKCPVLFLKMPIVWSWLSEECWSFVIKSHKKNSSFMSNISIWPFGWLVPWEDHTWSYSREHSPVMPILLDMNICT